MANHNIFAPFNNFLFIYLFLLYTLVVLTFAHMAEHSSVLSAVGLSTGSDISESLSLVFALGCPVH